LENSNETGNISLSLLKVGERGIIRFISSESVSVKRRFLDMGLIPGTEVSIDKKSPFGDPVSINLRGYKLCLRKHDLDSILVEVVA
jgi:Fe2+ transport system protein FeoA